MAESYIISEKTGLKIYTDTDSVVSEPEKRLMDLVAGAPPKNTEEAKLRKDIKEIIEKERVIDIPAM